jgi:hypothetical protein
MKTKARAKRYRKLIYAAGLMIVLAIAVGIFAQYPYRRALNCYDSASGGVVVPAGCDITQQDHYDNLVDDWLLVSFMALGIAIFSASVGLTAAIINRRQPKSYRKTLYFLIVAIPALILAAVLLGKLLYHFDPPVSAYSQTQVIADNVGSILIFFIVPGLSVAAAGAAATCGLIAGLEQKNTNRKSA